MQRTDCTNNHADDEFAVTRNPIMNVVKTALEVAPHFAPILLSDYHKAQKAYVERLRGCE